MSEASSFEFPDDDEVLEEKEAAAARLKRKDNKRKQKMGKKAKKLVEECLIISSESEKEGSHTKVHLAKKLGKDIMTLEVENQFAKLDAMGPLTEGEKWQLAEWLDKGRKKMEEVTLKTYRKGHDHCAAARRREAERETEGKSSNDNKEAEGRGGLKKERSGECSGSSKGKGVRKGRSIAQALVEEKALKDILDNKDKEMRRKHKEEVEATMLLGKVWGVQDEGRKDQTKRMVSKVLHEKREEALAKMKEDQKKYALDAITNDLGLPAREMWPFMYSDSEDDKDVYEDLEDIEEGLELVRKLSDKKKKKSIEEVNLGGEE